MSRRLAHLHAVASGLGSHARVPLDAEGRRLHDFTSGASVANLGHNSESWMKRFRAYMGWGSAVASTEAAPAAYFSALPMTAYNAVQLGDRSRARLIETLRDRPGGGRLEQVLWAASGSEAIQKRRGRCLPATARAT